jgi:hypothetical protein
LGAIALSAFAQKGAGGSTGTSAKGGVASPSAPTAGTLPSSTGIFDGSVPSPGSPWILQMPGSEASSPFLPPAPNGYDALGMSQSESCTSWTESGFHSPTVSTSRLAVPSKASGEYQKACGAMKDHKWTEAEEHVRKAIAVYPAYAAAWVMLGQVLDGEQKPSDAHEACTHAMSLDASYVAPYLCLAAFAARQNDWDQVAVLSDRAMTLDPVSNPFAFYFTALTQLHFQQIHQAEMNAMAALHVDTWHRIPELHYVLAQVYRAKGDLQDEAAQLRAYLKVAPPDAKDAPTARNLLAQLDTPPQK